MDEKVESSGENSKTVEEHIIAVAATEQSNTEERDYEEDVPFDHDACHKAFIRMIIIDEWPFTWVERQGFREMMSALAPLFTIPSRMEIVRDCLALFTEERKKLHEFFKTYSGSVCLTTDFWTSQHNLSYMSVAAHFIDDDWIFHKKIINFCQVSNHSSEMIGRLIEKCLLSWDIGKVFTVTIDNASADDVGIRYLKDRLEDWGAGCVLDGEFLHMRCGVHILNLIIKDCLSELSYSIERIRTAVRYVRSSRQGLQRFKACMERQKLSTFPVPSLDVETRWNTTCTMLESAIRVKKAFDLLEIQDGKYRADIIAGGLGLISEEDWNNVRGFVPFLKFLRDTTVKVSGSRGVTGNSYVREIFGLAVGISLMTLHGDETTRLMAVKMRNKFLKYWGDFRSVNLMVYLATVFDPRYKMRWVSWAINQVYEEKDAAELIGMIENVLEKMFKHYESFSVPKNSEASSQRRENEELNVNDIKDFDAIMASMYSEYEASQGLFAAKSELERYLMDVDECESRKYQNFDILNWWETTGSEYETLSLMARDLLAMPVSKVTLEFAFSTEGHVLDLFRSYLPPRMVEALICTKSWIQEENGWSGNEEIFEEMEELESEVSPLPMEPTFFDFDDE